MKLKKFKHSEIFPNNPLLMCIVGSSGSGKTWLLFNMLTTPNLLDFENLYIYTTTPNQPYYEFLKGLEFLPKETVKNAFLTYEENDEDDIEIEDILNSLKQDDTGIKVTITSSKSDLGFSKINVNKKNLVVFDNCVDEKNQDLQRNYFTKGRHNNCHCIYQAQTFYDIDNVIRKNSNVFILFTLNQRDLCNVMQSVNHGKDPKRFKEICKEMWDERYKYICINTLEPKNNISTGICDI